MNAYGIRGSISTLLALAVLAGSVAACELRSDLVFSPTTLPDAQVGTPYSATITVKEAATPVGGAGVQDGSLPAGMDLELAKDPVDTIVISGTPTAAGTFTFTVSVWCYGTNVAGQTGTASYTIVVR